MALSKVLIIAVFLFVNSETTKLPKEAPHNINDCPDPTKATALLDITTVQKDGQFLGHVEETYVFPKGMVNDKKISCILVTDLDANGHGGYPQITRDGVGYFDVEINMKSQMGRGLDFYIVIYGES